MDSAKGMTPKMPFPKLFLHAKHHVAITADSCIYVLDSDSGKVTHTTVTNQEQTDALRKSGAIVAANIDEDSDYLVTASADKVVRVWELDGLRVVSEREASKKPTDVRFNRDAKKIILCDKFGDVHCYPRIENTTGASETKDTKTKRRDAQRLHDDSLLLGHVSLLTTFLLSPDEQYIITADRDEHIRISWYPQSYAIEQFCLGHLKFVSALHIPPWDTSLLISGGGDPVLKIWNWLDGKLLSDIHIADVVMPYIKVTKARPSRGADGSDDEDKEKAEKKLSSRQRRRTNKKPKAKEDDDKELNEVKRDDNSNVFAQEEMDIDSGEVDLIESSELKGIPQSGKGKVKAEPLLAIQKIETVTDGSSKLIVFSAHGATAVFSCYLSLEDTPQVSAFDVGQPVLDFAIHPSSNKVYVSVDVNWFEETSDQSEQLESVKLLKINGSKLMLDDGSAQDPLLGSLNEVSRTSASSEALNNIDLYSALSILPKNVDFDNNTMDDNVESEALGVQLSGKELGRLKAKKAAMALEAAKRKTAEASGDGPDSPETKRKKSNGEDA